MILGGPWLAVTSLAGGLLPEWRAGVMGADELAFQGFTLVWHRSGSGYQNTCPSKRRGATHSSWELRDFYWWIFLTNCTVQGPKSWQRPGTSIFSLNCWICAANWLWVLFLLLCICLNFVIVKRLQNFSHHIARLKVFVTFIYCPFQKMSCIFIILCGFLSNLQSATDLRAYTGEQKNLLGYLTSVHLDTWFPAIKTLHYDSQNMYYL